MSSPNPIRATIIGGGLAGSLLALRLLDAGAQVTLIDSRLPHAASRVAAGLFNPVTGRLMALTWNAAALRQDLRSLQADPRVASFIHEAPIYFPFEHAGLRNKWSSLSSDPFFAPWGIVRESPWRPEQVHNPIGGLDVQQGGWMNTAGFITAVATAVTAHPHGRCIQSRVDYRSVDLRAGTLDLDGATHRFDHLICCEGPQLMHNPFFKWLPLKLLKGQLLEIEIDDFDPGLILTRGVFLLPLGGNRFLCGSTYEKEFSHEGPDEAGLLEIENTLKGTLKLHWRVVDHRAGIRPATPDRRPFIGTHPNHHNLHIINGLGAKGVLHGPWAARLLGEKIMGSGQEIETESSLLRYTDNLRNLIHNE